jgi:hypothetical protein
VYLQSVAAVRGHATRAECVSSGGVTSGPLYSVQLVALPGGTFVPSMGADPVPPGASRTVAGQAAGDAAQDCVAPRASVI